MKKSKSTNFFEKGTMLVQVVVFSAIATLFIGGLANWASLTLKSMQQSNSRELAMQIAEAGIEYYRWHLAHVKDDFTDGTGLPGPYIHDFLNKDGIKIGEFSLEITPPSVGSTIVAIKSTGSLLGEPNIKRSIMTRLAVPSWAKYAVAANDVMRFGDGTEVFGPIHSNKGIRFDGLAHNLITSAVASYDDPDHSGGNEFGVHTHKIPIDPLPPNVPPNRLDVFMAGRQFPVPAIDFSGITADLANMKSDAIANGKYLAPSGRRGYHIVFKINDTFDVFSVRTLSSVPLNCTSSGDTSGYWGSWSVASQNFVGNYPIPQNGIIFVDDHVWVDGQIDTARVTVAAGHFPDSVSERKSITVNNDLLYTNYDGKDTISLVAQQDINVGLYSEDNLRIDAALIAQNGRAGRFYYENDCRPENKRDTITLYGMIGSNKRYGFAYTDGTGYANRNIIYDANLLYSPPPAFPLTSDQYQTISWEEIE